jgi:hypothetical protein
MTAPASWRRMGSRPPSCSSRMSRSAPWSATWPCRFDKGRSTSTRWSRRPRHPRASHRNDHWCHSRGRCRHKHFRSTRCRRNRWKHIGSRTRTGCPAPPRYPRPRHCLQTRRCRCRQLARLLEPSHRFVHPRCWCRPLNLTALPLTTLSVALPGTGLPLAAGFGLPPVQTSAQIASARMSATSSRTHREAPTAASA